MKLRSNAKKKFLVDGGILYCQADKLYPPQRRDVDSDEFFGLIVQEHQTKLNPFRQEQNFQSIEPAVLRH